MTSIAFGLLAWFLTVVAAIRSIKLMIIVMLIIFAFLPRYIGVGIGADEFALSFRRIIILTVLLVVILEALRAKRSSISKPIKKYVALFLVTIVASTVSGLLNGFSSAILFRFLENIALIIVGSYVGVVAINKLGFERLVKYSFVWPLYVLVPLALVERVTGVFVFYEIFGTGIFASALGADFSIINSERIRSQVSFDGPLQFSEFLVLSLPFLFYMQEKKRSWKWLLLIVGAYLAILSTGSRTGVVMMVILTYLQIIYFVFGRNSGYRRRAIGLAILSVLFAVVGAFAYKLSTFEFVESFLVFDTVEEQSTYSRLRQFPVIAEILSHNPIIGLGYARNHTDGLGIAIDNFYLWTALEGGLISVIAVFLMIIMVIRKGLNLMSGKNSDELVRLGFAVTAFTTAFAIQKLFLQSPANLVYFFIFSCLLLTLSPYDFGHRRRQQVGHDIDSPSLGKI